MEIDEPWNKVDLTDGPRLATLQNSAVFRLGETVANQSSDVLKEESIWRQQESTTVCASNTVEEKHIEKLVYFVLAQTPSYCNAKGIFSIAGTCDASETAVRGHWQEHQHDVCIRNLVWDVVLIGCAVVVLPAVIFIVFMMNTRVRWRTLLLQYTKEFLEKTLPKEVANNLLEKYVSSRDRNADDSAKEGNDFFSAPIDNASVLFLDIKGFTHACSRYMSDTTAIVSALNHFFGELDKICALCGCLKIKTVGDQYMAARCAPTSNRLPPVGSCGNILCM